MNDDGVTERDGFGFFQSMVTECFIFLLFKIVDAKRVCSEEAVVACVPMGGAAEGFRVFDDGDDGGFAKFIGAGVSCPICAFSPSIEIRFSFGIC